MDAGELRDMVRVLDFAEAPEGWAWTERRKAWAKVELTGKTNLFSSVGIGARAAELTLRRQALSLHQAILWKGQHLFLTEITEPTPGWLNVKAAVVEVVESMMRLPAGKCFAGVLTEKYLRFEQQEPMAQNVITYVLVTPKVVELTPGWLVEVSGRAYAVRLAHVLDPYKNEYEIVRTEDL